MLHMLLDRAAAHHVVSDGHYNVVRPRRTPLLIRRDASRVDGSGFSSLLTGASLTEPLLLRPRMQTALD